MQKNVSLRKGYVLPAKFASKSEVFKLSNLSKENCCKDKHQSFGAGSSQKQAQEKVRPSYTGTIDFSKSSVTHFFHSTPETKTYSVNKLAFNYMSN